jgi:2-polyprenyl-3-methyl-5-hydroxy-6-metoxy-1,4-benzoquinol methylase
MPVEREAWNWNIEYQSVVLAAVPRHARTALDVGCGDGLLAFDLAERGLTVTGIDVDPPSVERACANARASTRTEFVLGDLFDYPFEAQSFDLVASISMLHHVDAACGLRRMRDLVRPDGVLVIVGFARPSSVTDHLRAIAGGTYAQVMKLRGYYWEHNAPTLWPPPCSMADMRQLATIELPGAQFRPLLSSRYAIIWQRDT